MRLRQEPSRHCRHIFNVQVPADQQVAVFLCRCRDGVRSAVEQQLASLRGAAASSLGLDEYQLNKKFAVNCTDARVQQLRAVAVVGAGHAPWDEIPAGAGIVPVESSKTLNHAEHIKSCIFFVLRGRELNFLKQQSGVFSAPVRAARTGEAFCLSGRPGQVLFFVCELPNPPKH